MSSAASSKASPPETVGQAQALVQRLGALEGESEALAGATGTLEVERIEAEMALEATPRPPGLDEADAVRVADALAGEARLAREAGDEAHADAATRSDAGELARLRAALAALDDWLSAPGRAPPRAIPRAARRILGLATAGAVAAAILLHPVFLVVLLPVAVPFAFLGLSGQDTAWLRLGAQRHYEHTGLRPPREWAPEDVRSRGQEIAGEIEALEHRASINEEAAHPGSGEDVLPEDPAALAQAREAALLEADRALAAAGLGRADLEGGVGAYLSARGRLREADARLRRLRTRRRSLEREAEDLRRAVLHWLTSRNLAPAAGRADTETLAAAVAEAAVREAAAGAAGPATSGGRKVESH